MAPASILDNFSPSVKSHVELILRDGKVGICAGNIRVTDLNSGDLLEYANGALQQGKCDRFKICIPYGGHSVTWEVLFNAPTPEAPPDFIFDDSDFCPDPSHLPSLVTWNPSDSSSLLSVIRELLDEYRQHNVSKLQLSPQLQFEYNSLVENSVFPAEGVEVYVLPQVSGKSSPVCFLIKLPVDFTKVPPYLLQDQGLGEDAAVLLVTYHSLEGVKATPQLYLSPSLEHAMGGTPGLRIPAYTMNTSLTDYVPQICDLLKNKVDALVQSYEQRKEYMAAMLTQFGSSVIEYDIKNFAKLSLLFEWNDFCFLIHIHVPIQFPSVKPHIQFQSIYHQMGGKLYQHSPEDYPYSPRWSGNEMATRLRKFMLESIVEFRNRSCRSGHI